MVRVLGFLTLFIDHDLTVFTTNDETLGVNNDAFDVETFPRALTKEHFVVAGTFKKHDFSLVRAHNQTAIGHPCVASEVVRDVCLLLGDLIVCLFQRVVLLHSEELISVVTSHNHNVMIGRVKGAVKWLHVLG